MVHLLLYYKIIKSQDYSMNWKRMVKKRKERLRKRKGQRKEPKKQRKQKKKLEKPY